MQPRICREADRIIHTFHTFYPYMAKHSLAFSPNFMYSFIFSMSKSCKMCKNVDSSSSLHPNMRRMESACHLVFTALNWEESFQRWPYSPWSQWRAVSLHLQLPVVWLMFDQQHPVCLGSQDKRAVSVSCQDSIRWHRVGENLMSRCEACNCLVIRSNAERYVEMVIKTKGCLK